jgi:hypothetical protein
VREGKVTGKWRLLERREDSCPAVELPHSKPRDGLGGHPAADGEALSSWKSQEQEAGEVLGGLGVDDDAVGGEWVGPSRRREGGSPLFAKRAKDRPPASGLRIALYSPGKPGILSFL